MKRTMLLLLALSLAVALLGLSRINILFSSPREARVMVPSASATPGTDPQAVVDKSIDMPHGKTLVLSTNIMSVIKRSDGKVRAQYGTLKTMEFAKISAVSKRRYCKHVGACEFVEATTLTDVKRSARWEKVAMIRKYLRDPSVDYLVWTDADVMVAGNPSTFLPFPNSGGKDLYVTLDYNAAGEMSEMVNTGVLFIRRSTWSVNFFDKVWEHNDEGRGATRRQ